ncbi:MAG: uracil-DNA glycosylase family protein, partial [Acidimicrobiales bacterium]
MTGDDPTVAIYEQEAVRWVDRRKPGRGAAAAAFADRVGGGRGPILDAGTGPGWYLARLGANAIGLDAAGAMLDVARAQYAPDHPLVQADLARPPFRRESLGGAWASNSYVHVDRRHLPAALAHLHAALAVDAPIELSLFEGDRDHGPFADDDFPGRRFSAWQVEHLRDVLVGAGFGEVEIEQREGERLCLTARRLLSLPDSVGPDMRVLFCGLNPSVHAARAGVGYVGPGNRFWPVVEQAGLVTRPRDPWHALDHDGIGMTDLVERTTARAADLADHEFATGVDRLERLVGWLRPGVVCFVGLQGWRTAIDRRATAGLQ